MKIILIILIYILITLIVTKIYFKQYDYFTTTTKYGYRCADCPSNSTSQPGSMDQTDCLCNAGYEGNNGGPCTICQAGTFKNSTGSGHCEECDIGKYKPNAGIGDCSSCPQYSITSSSGSINITDCKCDKGYTGPNGDICTICESGKYKDVIGDSDCISCPTNSNSPSGSDSVEDCQCDRGFVGPDGGTCTICESGKYKDVIGDFDCTDCPTNSTSLAGSEARTDCKCDKGFSGSDGGQCTACRAGTYKNIIGSDSCLSCEAGKIAIGTGNTSCNQCPNGEQPNQQKTDCEVCPEGTAGINGQCNQCPDGEQPNQEKTQCEVCPYRYAGINGRCNQCPDGEEPNREKTSCVSCSSGTWGMGGACSACVGCPAGQDRQGCGGTSSGTCVDCPDRYYKSSYGTDSCIWAPTYSNIIKNEYERNISFICHENFYKSGPNCNICTSCGPGQQRTGCFPDGFGLGAGYCSPCGSGTYKSDYGNHLCTAVPTGATPNYDKDGWYCSSGYHYINNRCELCSLYACPMVGQWRSGCSHYTRGTCQDCNYYCPAGKEKTGCSGTNSGTCTLCGDGKYKSSPGEHICTSCAGCPINEERVKCEGASPGECKVCTNGYHKDNTGAGDCTWCGQGQIASSTGGCTCEEGYAMYSYVLSDGTIIGPWCAQLPFRTGPMPQIQTWYVHHPDKRSVRP